MNWIERAFTCRWGWAAALAVLGSWSALAQDAPEVPQEVPRELDAAKTVAGVQVIGARRVAEQRILNEVKTRSGQSYRPHLIREDVRRLDATQWFHSVAVEERQTAEGVHVVFRVIERATLQEVVYEGAKHVDKEELEKITGLRKGSPMSVALNRRAARAIEDHYHNKLARLFASVELVEGGRDEDTRVVFRVTEGPVVRLNDIRFVGNQFVTAGRLRTQIDSSRKFLGLGGKYRPEMLENDLQKLTEYYHLFGFFDVKIHREFHWNPGHKTADVVFVVDEGVRYLVGGYEIAGNKRLDSEILQASHRLKEDEPFSGRKMQQTSRSIQDEYGKRGYYTRVIPDLRFSEDPGVVHVVYQVVEGPPAKVGEVVLVGNRVTRQNVIFRQLQVYPGQVLSYPDLRASERNLARLNIFKNSPELGIAPTVTVLDPEDPSEYKTVLVQVEEDRTGSLLFGVGINSDAGATASIVLNERNFDITRFPTSWDDIWENRAFRGAGQELRIEAVPGTEISRYSVSFREPYLFDSPFSLATQGYYYTRRFDEYDERRFGGRITVGHRFTPIWSGSVGVRVEDVKVDNFAFFAPRDFHEVAGHNLVVAPKVALARDTRDSILRPTEGNHFEVSFEQGLGDFSYPIVNVEDTHYWTIHERPDGSGRHVIALRGQMAIAGDDTPLFDRLYAGGFRTLRGFEFRGVGPSVNGFRVGGKFLLLGSVEYQIPILANDNIYAVVFSDFGTVEDDVSIRDFRASVGAGLRLIVPMFGPVPIALDWAYPVAKADTDEREIFSFWVGFFR